VTIFFFCSCWYIEVTSWKGGSHRKAICHGLIHLLCDLWPLKSSVLLLPSPTINANKRVIG